MSSNNRSTRLTYSASFKGRRSMKNENDSENYNFSRDNEMRHSTGSMKGLKRMEVNSSQESSVDGPPSVHHLIKGFQTKITSTTRPSKDYVDSVFTTPGYVVDSPIADAAKGPSSRRKLSLRNKKNKLTASEARYTILKSLGMSPFIGNENRTLTKSFAFFDVQSLFFNMNNAAALKGQFGDGASFQPKLSGASAASQRNNAGRKRFKSGEFDPQLGRFRSRGESMIDEGDSQENHLILNCPYFRNEIAIPEKTDENKGTYMKQGRDISKLISMFNKTRSSENVRHDNYDIDKRFARRRQLESSEQDIILEKIEEGSHFFSWDEPNVSGKQLFDFEHIDRGAMFYREFFFGKEHSNLFGVDEKYGPVAISIVREILPKTAVLVSGSELTNKNQAKRHQYRLIMRTCELYSLRICLLENSIPSSSRHNASRAIPLKDVLEFCFPDLQIASLRHCSQTPKVGEQLLKLDERQLSLTYKVGLLYCKAGQKTEEEMYNNEFGGSEFMEFCSVIADKVALKGFQGYRAQLDINNDSTGQHSLYTTFHGREIMFHVSTELPFTAGDKQQLLRKRHIGNDIVTVIFQESGSEPFTPQMMRSHFQHVFIVVRVENPHTDDTKYEVAVSRSHDVPYFGPPIPPDKFNKTSAFREFLLTKIINAENAAHKSEKFTHMARRTRYGYLKDLAENHTSTQTLETSNKFGFSFSSKKKEKTKPPVNPEIWLHGGLVWTVKFEFDEDIPGTAAFLSISTKSVTFIEQDSQEILATLSCKSVLGWKSTSHTMKLFYDSGKMAHFSLTNDDLNELPFVVNRLKAVTPGCETQDLTLRRNNDGQLGFHVFYEGLVAEVEPYGMAWHSGLRKSSRILEISGQVVSKMSHERMIMMLKRPGAVRITVLPPAPDGQPRNYKAVRNMRRYSSMTSVYSMSINNMAGTEEDYSSGLSSSKEQLHNSEVESRPSMKEIKSKTRSLSLEGPSARRGSTSSTSESYSSTSSPRQPSPETARKALNASQERIIASRSATDITKVSSVSPKIATKNPPLPPKKTVISPQASLDQEWGDLERNLTDARKSIDAKFYRSLAKSQSPFFKASRPPGLMSPEEDLSCEEHPLAAETEKNETKATVYTRRPSETIYPIVNEQLNFKIDKNKVLIVSSLSTNSDSTCPENNKAATEDNSVNKVSSNFKNDFETPGYAIIDTAEQFGLKKSPHKTNKERSVESNVSASQSTENLAFENSDSNKRKSLVKTKVRDADEIINERLQNSPVTNRKELFIKSCSVDSQPTNAQKSTIKTGVSVAARKQMFASNTQISEDRYSPVHSPRVGSPTNYFRKFSEPIVKTTAAQVTPQRVSSPTQRVASPTHRVASPVQRVVSPIQRMHSNTDTSKDVKRKSPETIKKFDESLSETFAKIDAAFGFKSTTPTQLVREEKRKKRKSVRRRSRNCEPPSSDSSSESVGLSPSKRNSRTYKRFVFEDTNGSKGPKSEAEESLEAAISDFQMSLKKMPAEKKERSGSSDSYNLSTPRNSLVDDDDMPPQVPVRTSKPQILTDMKRLRQMKSDPESLNELESNNSHHRTKSENNMISSSRPESPLYRPTSSVAVLRPWTPSGEPKVEPSKNIRDNVKKSSIKGGKPPDIELVNETLVNNVESAPPVGIEDQLSPLPMIPITPHRGGIQSLPHRSKRKKKRCQTVTGSTNNVSSSSCIPLVVRGLDLASCRDSSLISHWSKEDLQVMLTVMESELEQEREEKERLALELNRSREEKERLLEQSKQAASQLKKFTSLFLDSTNPKEIKEKMTSANLSR